MKTVATLILSALLCGCVVSQTRSGVSFGFIDPGMTVAEFESANGAARLRRHVDGTYGLRFPEKLSQYRMGSFDDVRLIARHHAGGRTAALFERRRGSCVDYELVTIAPGEVGRNNVGSGCNRRVEAGVVDGVLVMREAVEGPARFWIWSANGLATGRESRIAAPRDPRPTPEPKTAPKPGRPAAQAPAPASATPKARGVAARPAASRAATPAARPVAPAAPTRIALPSGSIRTESVQPVRVVLERGG